MIFLNMATYISLKKRHSHWMYSKIINLRLKINSVKRIKSVRSDRGGEYYGRYDGSGEQRPGPFAKFLEECGIVLQYTIPGSPMMNGVAKR